MRKISDELIAVLFKRYKSLVLLNRVLKRLEDKFELFDDGRRQAWFEAYILVGSRIAMIQTDIEVLTRGYDDD